MANSGTEKLPALFSTVISDRISWVVVVAALAMMQMPPGIPVATVAINGALNAAILALQILSTADDELKKKMIDYKESLKEKIVKANQELDNLSYKFKV